MQKVLIVEDDDFLREALSDQIKEGGYIVKEAPNGAVARDIMGLTDFDLVISDIKMPHMDGIELLEWSKERFKTPFVIITGFAHLEETKAVFDLGVQHFLSKPFRREELLTSINECLNKKSTDSDLEQEFIKKDDKHCKVSIDEFVSKSQVDFDIYIKLSDKKYVCVAKAGANLDRERIDNYKKKGLKHLYILKEDFSKLVNLNLKIGNALQADKNISPEKKLNFMKYTGEVILERAFVSGIDKQSFAEANEYLGLAVETLSNSEEFVDLLELLNSHSNYIYAQSVASSMYSIMIARNLGFESQQVFFKLSMAGMFHDIGLKEIDSNTLEKKRALLTPDQRRLIESHPTRSKEILISLQGIPEDVVRLSYEHHEDCVGQGFPQSIRSNKQHPLSKVFQLACLFAEVALVSPQNPKGRTAAEAILHIKNVYEDRVDSKVLMALYDVLTPECQAQLNLNA